MSEEAYTPPLGMPSVFDEAFLKPKAGQKVGIEIWRIEKFKVVKKAPTEPCYQGKFNEGDSYIILQTKNKKAGSAALERHIFYWIGKESSQDEYGCVAYKTVELDESLGGEPVQHRETQGHETAQFASLFKSLSYMAGGIETGFRKVDRNAFDTRLLQVKGKRSVRVNVVELSPKSMNVGDCFVLDAGRTIFQWNGPESSGPEKMKALEVTREIRDQERSGNATLIVIEGNSKTTDPAHEKLFWEKMGCSRTTIRSAAAGGDDASHGAALAEKIKLYVVSDASGKLSTEEVKTRPLKQNMLNTNDSYVLDVAGSSIFAWIGKQASSAEKLHSSKIAMDFIKSKGYPLWTPFARVVEGGETPLFKQNFSGWVNKDATKNIMAGGMRRQTSNPGMTRQFSASSMFGQKKETQVMVDDGKGVLEIWRVENLRGELVAVPKPQYGQFYSGDSYVMLYTYGPKGDEKYIIYFWIGKFSTQDEYAGAALAAKALDDKMGGKPVQVRVTQNKEPDHFYTIFKGQMVVHAGGKKSSFGRVTSSTEKGKKAIATDEDSYDLDGTRLFQIKGTDSINTRATQVEEKAAFLNSNDVFFLETPKERFIWCGTGCTGDEREFAKSIREKIAPGEYTMILEGREPEAFWAAIGGKGPYLSPKDEVVEATEPRLFQMSNNKGYFYAEEIFQWDQDDLIEDDVMLLDTGKEVFIWVGNGANADEKKQSFKAAEDYIKDDPSGRKVEDVCFLSISQGYEPVNFTGHFISWNPHKWSGGKTYEEMKATALSENKDPATFATKSLAVAAQEMSFQEYPYADLVSNPHESVDKTKKEMYLSDAEFQQYMGITKEAYNAMPAWKRSGLKKKAKLY